MKRVRRILLADSEPHRAPLTRLVLRTWNYNVDLASNGRYDLRRYDLLLICGTATAQWTKGTRRTPAISYVANMTQLSSSHQQILEAAGMRALIDAIRSHLRRRSRKEIA